jgi:flagellar protein FliL
MSSKAHTSGREEKGAKTEKKSGGKKRVLIIVGAVLLLGAGGGGAAWYLDRKQDSAEVQVKQKPPVFVTLDTFTVNLQSEHGDQHLQTNLTLKIEDAAAADLIKLHMPEIRNRVLLLLSSKAASQIAAVEGKRKLASELLAEIRQPFGENRPELAVQSVLFTSFVIQ